MEYNTKREKLLFYDYGRSVHKMIRQAMRIADREQRTLAARNIVATMAIVNPSVKNDAKYEQKLWDHLMIWSNYELDVDCPYPVERSQVNMRFQPHKLGHKDNKIRFRHYGKFMEGMVRKAASMPQGEERDYLVRLVANLMVKDYHEWNHDSVPPDVIAKQLADLSDGQLTLPPNLQFALAPQRMQGAQHKRNIVQKKKYVKKKGK